MLSMVAVSVLGRVCKSNFAWVRVHGPPKRQRRLGNRRWKKGGKGKTGMGKRDGGQGDGNRVWRAVNGDI